MKQHLLKIMVFCAACMVLGAQAQSSSGSSAGGASSPGAASSSTSGSQTDTSSGISSQSSTPGSPSYSRQSSGLSATGRMGQHEVRASKLMGAEVKSSSGETLGTINDVLLNPTSGRIDFAVISLNSTGSEGTSTSATPSTTSSATATSGGKLAAVPWTLLRSSGAGYGTSTASAAGAYGSEQSFVFSGDKSKFQGAPSFDQSTWPDVSGSEWRQSIYSYYGVSGSAAGGAYSPGGSGSSRGSSLDNSSSTTAPSSSSGSSPNSSSSDKP